MRDPSQPSADDRFKSAKRRERLHIEQFDPARLEQRRDIARAVIGRERERLQRRHLSRFERAPEFRDLAIFLCAFDVRALDPFLQPLLERR